MKNPIKFEKHFRCWMQNRYEHNRLTIGLMRLFCADSSLQVYGLFGVPVLMEYASLKHGNMALVPHLIINRRTDVWHFAVVFLSLSFHFISVLLYGQHMTASNDSSVLCFQSVRFL